MNNKTNSSHELFTDCYTMQPKDVEAFAEILADGFSNYSLFKQILGGVYDKEKMKLFWKTSILVSKNDSIFLADSEEIHSVLIFTQPKSKEHGIFSYLRNGGIKLIIKIGIKSIIRFLQFNDDIQKYKNKYQGDNDGYLLAFATDTNKQHHGYGKKTLNALLKYLDSNNIGCYLETFDEENINLYKHFGFELMEQSNIRLDNLPLMAMYRRSKHFNSN